MCVGVRDWFFVGGVCGCVPSAPLLLCYFSWGTFYKKIIYCTSFVYLEKRLKLFVALSSSGWVSVGCHCHLQVPRQIEATWNTVWPLPSPSPSPTHLTQEEGSPSTLRHDPSSCLPASLRSQDNSHWVYVEPSLLPALKQTWLMLPYKEKLMMNV